MAHSKSEYRGDVLSHTSKSGEEKKGAAECEKPTTDASIVPKMTVEGKAWFS